MTRAFTLAAVVAVLATGASAGGGTTPDEPRFLTYDEAVAAGFAVPDLDPALPICPDDLVDDGFGTAEEEEQEVDDNAEDTCQLDPRTASYPVGVPARGGPPDVGAGVLTTR